MLAIILLLPLALADPGLQLQQCVDNGASLDSCTETILEELYLIMETGIPDLDPPVPPMDPLSIEEIQFQFGSVNIDFLDLVVRGLKQFSLNSSHVNKQERTWEVTLAVPRLEVVGTYTMSGQLFIDLGLSQGDETFNATDVTLTAVGGLADREGKIHIDTMNLTMEVQSIAIAMDCLFPRGSPPAITCCPNKWGNSCNPGLAKTVHKFINGGNNGQKFVKEFQPQISSKVGAIIRDFLNSALQNVDSSYMIGG